MLYSTTISVGGLLQVIVGITNPPAVATITWTLVSYEYYNSASNYGQQIQSTSAYAVYQSAGTPQSSNKLRMLPFNTKVYSTDHTPFRIAFKLSDDPPSLPDLLDFWTPYTMVLSGFEALSAPNNFQFFSCQFKEYSLLPSPAQPVLPNSYWNWKEETQYIPLYAYCRKDAAGNLVIEMPRVKPLSNSMFYELVVMPTGPGMSKAGFSVVSDTQFRLIATPGSC